MKQIVIKVALVCAGVAVAFLLLEALSSVILKTCKFQHSHVSPGIAGKDVVEYPTLFVKDSDLFWKMLPNCGDTNSQGFFDREFSPRKAEGVFRIVCMGDSITFGFPAPIDETYPNVLERLLERAFVGKKIEVINAGVPGYSSFQGLVLLQKKILAYQPDLLIVYYGVNDRECAAQQDKEARRLPGWVVGIENAVSRFQLYKLCTKLALCAKYPPGRVLPGHRVTAFNYRKNLKRISQIAGECGAATLCIVRPAFYDPQTRTVFTDASYAPPRGVWQFDIYAVFKERERQAAELFLDDYRPFNFHLTQKGQRLLAEEVFKALMKNQEFVRRLTDARAGHL